jgi:hypothetical protein
MAKIYISSTYKDLVEHRASVRDALWKAGHEVRAMEAYLASDERPADVCCKDVGECEIYVGIFAWRYGFIPEEDNPEKKSITELEYLHAGELGRERLIFLLDEDADWKPPMMDSQSGESEGGALIKALRHRLDRAHTVARFRSREQLALLVSLAVGKVAPNPRPTSSETIQLPQPWQFDITSLVDACLERMDDRGLIGLGIPCAEAELLKNFSEKLRVVIGRSKAKVRPVQKVDPKYFERAAATIGLNRPQLAHHDVLCPVVLYDRPTTEGHDINARFWKALSDTSSDQLEHRLIVVMGRDTGGITPPDLLFPDGIIVLPAPEFTHEHVSCWIQGVAECLGWSPRHIVAWKRSMLACCGQGGSLWIAGVYHHIEFAVRLLQGNPTADEFLAELQGEPVP